MRQKLLSLFILLILGFAGLEGRGQVNIIPTQTITESFSIGINATATLPASWKCDKNTTVRLVGNYPTAITTATELRAGKSMANNASNGIYNFGAGDAASATDRAVGGLSSGSGSKSVNVYVKLKNTSTNPIGSFTISYAVEKYRNGNNPAGFTIQMYYSTNGTSWTSAGDDFKTSFSADADNEGYASAPGTTVNITNKALNQTVAANGEFYLAWNYSVTSGTTTSNAQALGIDDVSIKANPVVTAPTLNPDVTNNTVDNHLDITFTDNSTWRSAISEVLVGTTSLVLNTGYSISAGVLTLMPEGNAILQTPGSKLVTVKAAGYPDATVTQSILVGIANKLLVQDQPSSPLSNGGAFVGQPTIKVCDQYNNLVESSTASVVASVGSGTWSLGGTTTISAVNGLASFSNLSATSSVAVLNATMKFTSLGLTQATSNTFNLNSPSASSTFINTGNWFELSNWTNGIPGEATDVTISGNATVIGAANCHDLTISSTASLTVSGSNELYVFGDFEIQSSGALTGSFIGAKKTAIGGNTTVQCYVSADNYHYISSPVAPQSFGSIFPDNQNNIYLRRYNEPTGEWVNMLKTDNSQIGLGYSVTMNAPQIGSFKGVLNPDNVTKTLSKAGTASGGSASDYNGWNLIGNPFSSAINWADVLAANQPAPGFEGSAYIWSGSNYIATNGTSGGISGNLIPICSGFFVKASINGAQILIPTSAQAHSNHGIYKEAILNNLAVKVTGDQYEDQTFVRFHDQATEGFDSRWDARKLEGLNEAPQLYTTAGEYKLSINEQPKQSKRDIPMNFSCGVDGQYTLTFSGVESFEIPSRITLEDKLLGSTIDVTNSLSYNFSYNTIDDEDRFILHFSTATGISDKEVQNIQIWAANHQLFIDNQAGVVGDVTLYDITGKKILAKQVTEGKSIINVNGLNGTYIVRIATVKGVVTKKVVLL